jgi:hypothetical protein
LFSNIHNSDKNDNVTEINASSAIQRIYEELSQMDDKYNPQIPVIYKLLKVIIHIYSNSCYYNSVLVRMLKIIWMRNQILP